MIEIPFANFRRTNRFKSGGPTETYGSYHHQYIQIAVASSRDALMNSDQIQDFIEKNPNRNDQLTCALRNAAAIHEYRHFLDCFGTLSGITLFGTYLIELKEFLRLCSYLEACNSTWQLPIWEWLNRNDCPDQVLKFAESYRQRLNYRDVFMGALELPPARGTTEEIWRDCFIPQLDIVFPIYPLKLMRFVEKGGKRIKQDVATVWHAIGFETIVEGNAQALQRDILESLWPEEIAELAWTKIIRTETRVEYMPENSVSSYDVPSPSAYYNLTDYVVSKFLKKIHGITQLPRSLIAQMSDVALMEASFPDSVRSPVKRHPGDTFINILRTTDWKKPIDHCIRDCIIPEKSLEEVIGGLSEIPRPERLFSTMSSSSHAEDIIRVVESYVQHEIVIPLLELRMKHGHKILYDFTIWSKMSESLPKPLVSVYDGRVYDYLPEAQTFMLEIWAIFAMMRNMFEQIMSGATVICCPRAYETVAGLNRVEYAESGSCREYISRRKCGRWAPGREIKLPKCVFATMIKRLRLG